jgi:hypothetical protein
MSVMFFSEALMEVPARGLKVATEADLLVSLASLGTFYRFFLYFFWV